MLLVLLNSRAALAQAVDLAGSPTLSDRRIQTSPPTQDTIGSDRRRRARQPAGEGCFTGRGRYRAYRTGRSRTRSQARHLPSLLTSMSSALRCAEGIRHSRASRAHRFWVSRGGVPAV